MSGRAGSVEVTKFVAGTAKGGITHGTLFADPFKQGKYTEDRTNYTSETVIEKFTAAGESGQTDFTVMFDIVGVLKVTKNGTEVDKTGYTFTGKKVTLTSAAAAGAVVAIAYKYDMVTVPQDTIPSLIAQREFIALEAKPRRIKVEFSNIAAYEYKQETGADLLKSLEAQAVAELNLEIDNEGIEMLFNGGKDSVDKYDGLDSTAKAAKLSNGAYKWNKRLPHAISKTEHYEGFSEFIQELVSVIYDRTHKFNANYLVVGSGVKPMFALMKGWKPVSNVKEIGSTYIGELDGLKVYCTPVIGKYNFFLGFNSNDIETSAGIFAPWMGIVPTQLLEYADGMNSRGWCTLYDMKMLNDCLIVPGVIVDEDYATVTE